VVSHHLDGLLRAGASGLLRPEADRGSLRFAMDSPLVSRASRRHARDAEQVDDRLDCTTTPRNAVHTLRRIPLASSRTVSPRPLPSCRSVRTSCREASKCSTDPDTRRQAVTAADPCSPPRHCRSRPRCQAHLDDSAVRALAPPTTTLLHAEACQRARSASTATSPTEADKR